MLIRSNLKIHSIKPISRNASLTRLALKLFSPTILLLQACVSYEPAMLIPSLNLSPEEISLTVSNSSADSRIDFGLELSVNESDSLINVEVLPGVRVRNVSNNGAADSAGIQPGDIILSVDGIETNHPDVVLALQQQTQEETEFEFILRRNTVVYQATVIGRLIGGSSAAVELYRIDPLATRAGYRTEMVNIRSRADVAAAQVVELFPDSPLEAAGIEIGDRILSINGEYLNSAQDLIRRLNQDFSLGETVLLGAYNGESVSEREVKLWDPGRRISRISLGPLLQYESSLDPASNNLSILDFWLFSFYTYSRIESERSHSLLGLFNISSDIGELTEEEN